MDGGWDRFLEACPLGIDRQDRKLTTAARARLKKARDRQDLFFLNETSFSLLPSPTYTWPHQYDQSSPTRTAKASV